MALHAALERPASARLSVQELDAALASIVEDAPPPVARPPQQLTAMQMAATISDRLASALHSSAHSLSVETPRSVRSFSSAASDRQQCAAAWICV